MYHIRFFSLLRSCKSYLFFFVASVIQLYLAMCVNVYLLWKDTTSFVGKPLIRCVCMCVFVCAYIGKI